MGEAKGRVLVDSTLYNGDRNGAIIPGGSGIREIINTALNTSTFVAITTTKDSKQIQFTTSDNTAFYISDVEAGTTSQAIPANAVINWAGGFEAGTIFWAKASAGTPNLELVVID